MVAARLAIMPFMPIAVFPASSCKSMGACQHRFGSDNRPITMTKTNTFTKILTLVGTVLIWFPLLMPFIFAFASLMLDGRFRLDYLMPAELFPVALLGGGLLLWAALRAHAHIKWIGWGLVIAIVLLFGGQALAVVTGLASGETEATPLLIGLVLVPILLYAVTLGVVGAGGIQMARELFRKPQSTTAP